MVELADPGSLATPDPLDLPGAGEDLDEGPPVPAEDRCYGFADFDMHGELHAPAFESDGTTWLVHDQYCANPACDCRAALLCFMTIDPDARVARENFGVEVDLRSRRPRRLEGGPPLSRDQLDTLLALQQELGNWLGELGLRRSLLRQIAARRLRRAAAPARSRRTKPGRNDACRCGSGRKYKKCCGAL